jgi:acyl-CoA synthetase (AMP-forming)/AMP-acid ligase II
MPLLPDASLWSVIAAGGRLNERFIRGAEHGVAIDRLVCGSSLDRPVEEFINRSVVIATTDQFTAALALVELDGIARRLVLCPPDLSAAHIAVVAETAQADVIVSDGRVPPPAASKHVNLVICSPEIRPAEPLRCGCGRSEWILLTSGTTGVPKLVVHTPGSLIAPIKPGAAASPPAVWSTFYDIRRYGGLQIFLRAMLGGGELVLSSASETTADFLTRAGGHRITHISGTPSHWRRALMSPAAGRISPKYVRLSGEIADQPILDDLQAFYRRAGVGHAFASTEAGVAFEVNDGLAGFPVQLIGQPGAEVEMKIADGSLRIRSARTALGYLGPGGELRDPDGFVDTGDMIERRGDRYHFVGRRGGIINVGGLKVHPEEVEAVINHHPAVQMCLVTARKNRFTGSIVVAEVVLRGGEDGANRVATALQNEILDICRHSLPAHKVPATIRFVSSVGLGAAGKLARAGG